MHEIIENNMMGRRTVIATAESFIAAKEAVVAMGVAFMEDDADYPECADAYLNDGRVLAIQPTGFKAKEAANYAKGVQHAKVMHDAMNAFDAEFLK